MKDPQNRTGVSSFVDAHGKTRWRYRRKGKTKALPGQPGEPEFEETLAAAIEGRPPRNAAIVGLPNAAEARTLGAAWRGVTTESLDWKQLTEYTRGKNRAIAEDFLFMPVKAGKPVLWKDVPIAEVKRRHVKLIVSAFIETPHKAKRVIVNLRRMIDYAMDMEWIETDPTYRLNFNPTTKGWRAWTFEELFAFMDFHPPGTQARTIFAIALWLGDRRGDVANLRRDQVDWKNRRVRFQQLKGGSKGKRMDLPLVDPLALALFAAPARGEHFATVANGNPRSAKGMTNDMQAWTKEAGLPPGCTIHGLRKTLGKLAAEGEATTRQSMELLGHSDIKHAELYSREAEAVRLADAAMRGAVISFEERVANRRAKASG